MSIPSAAVALAEGATGFTLTADMLNGLTSTVQTNAGVLVPVGIAIMAIVVSISLIPKIIRKFV